VALFTPSDAVIATPAMGSSFFVSASRCITAPSIVIDRCTGMDRNQWARNNSAMTTAAATAIIAQTIFFPVMQYRQTVGTRNLEYTLSSDYSYQDIDPCNYYSIQSVARSQLPGKYGWLE
jgi:hypothetical protein